GMAELGEDIFHMPVRVGSPLYEGALADVIRFPQYAAAMGLVIEGAAQRRRGIQARDTSGMKQIWGRLRDWFGRNF
ncbi:MAG: cell division protein FtsA, partial [Azoarcus sp.]|nr:cell division protein FtsA [Azoarcus sp.]